MNTQQSNGQRAMGPGVPKLAELTDTVMVSDTRERNELSKRDRSLVTVAALFASYRLAELPLHLDRAFENGVTKEELVGSIAHLAFYTGWRTAASAIKLLSRSQVINDHRTHTRK